jgi:hypothetical protein
MTIPTAASPRFQRTGGGTTGDLGRHPGETADGEREPDILLGPSKARQIEGQKGPEAHLDIAEKEIGPVETPPAPVAELSIQALSPLAMFHDDAMRAGRNADDRSGYPCSPAEVVGCHLRLHAVPPAPATNAAHTGLFRLAVDNRGLVLPRFVARLWRRPSR